MKKSLLLVLVLISFITKAQNITGKLKQHAGQKISLTGFDYYKNYELAKTTLDSLGNFTLSLSKDYKGMAILKTQDKSNFVFVVAEPTIYLEGNHLRETDSLQFINSLENKNYVKYAKEQGLRGNALSALDFLYPLYQNEPLFAKQKKILKKLQREKIRLRTEDVKFVSNLPKNSYVRWFIPYRKLLQEMPIIVRKKTQEIPHAIAQFRNIDFKNPNFKTSGLFKEVIEGHYLLIENMGQSLDSIYGQMNLSTKYIIDNLKANNTLLNEVSNQLFTYFEKRSLFKVSEYLSVTLLNDSQYSLNANLASKLESYRKVKVGAIAPNIILKNNQKLSDLKTNKLVVFGASWCPKCKIDAIDLLKQYDAWKSKNVEIVYISIDTDKVAFETANKNVPWQTHCDYKGWETQAAKDYYVSGTPSYFLLDGNNKILVRPNSIAHANAWIQNKI